MTRLLQSVDKTLQSPPAGPDPTPRSNRRSRSVPPLSGSRRPPGSLLGARPSRPSGLESARRSSSEIRIPLRNEPLKLRLQSSLMTVGPFLLRQRPGVIHQFVVSEKCSTSFLCFLLENHPSHPLITGVRESAETSKILLILCYPCYPENTLTSITLSI